MKVHLLAMFAPEPELILVGDVVGRYVRHDVTFPQGSNTTLSRRFASIAYQHCRLSIRQKPSRRAALMACGVLPSAVHVPIA
jgi:hypothetical protein